jgi:hypothetical protein
MSAPLVVKVGSFSEFRQEIDGGRVRLCSTETTRGAAGPLAIRELDLHIQGINLDREIVWLCYSRTIQLGPNGKPWRDTDKQVSRAWAGLHDLVKAYLEERYDVHGGMSGIPHDIKPLNAGLEFVTWHKDTATFILSEIGRAHV